MAAGSWNSRIKKTKLLIGNAEVNTLLWQQINMKQQKNHGNDVFYVVQD